MTPTDKVSVANIAVATLKQKLEHALAHNGTVNVMEIIQTRDLVRDAFHSAKPTPASLAAMAALDSLISSWAEQVMPKAHASAAA